MSEIIKDDNLSRIIEKKMLIQNLVSIEEIEELNVSNRNLRQEDLKIDLSEIYKIKNLKKITLKFFEITDEVIDVINKLEFLETIEFSTCLFKTNKMLSGSLKTIFIYNCEIFNIDIISRCELLEEFLVIHSGVIDINKLTKYKNLRFIKLAHCNVIGFSNLSKLTNLEELYLNSINIPEKLNISKMYNLKYISLNGSKVIDKSGFIKDLKEQQRNLIIKFEDEDHPIE